MVFKDVVRKLIKEQGLTQMEAAKKAGFQSQSGFATTLSRENMGVDNMLRILDALGYTLAIVKKDDVNLTFLEMSEKKSEK